MLKHEHSIFNLQIKIFVQIIFLESMTTDIMLKERKLNYNIMMLYYTYLLKIKISVFKGQDICFEATNMLQILSLERNKFVEICAQIICVELQYLYLEVKICDFTLSMCIRYLV